ncbi:MAG TPA: GGDEF domain-containing protein [Lachnospiraceae bacterium]|nr:GGDEF domain-containing protein [Lachnospiraceae bacterium]
MINNYSAMYIIDICALLFLFALLNGNNLLKKHRKNSFSYGIIFSILIILSEIGSIVANGGSSNLRGLNILCNVLGFTFTPMIPIVLINIFHTSILRKYKLLLLPTLLNIVVVMLSPIHGFIFYIDEYNQYERGSIFFCFVVVYVINIIIFGVIIGHTGQKYLYPIKRKTAGLFLFTVFGTCIQVLIPSAYSTWHCVTLSLFLLYILLSEFEGSFDLLTGLFNRAAFEKASKQLIGNKMFTIIAMDINKFKEINDTYGHDYGDIILKEVATIIRESFDDNCSCYRIGGDEFYIISRITNLEKLELQFQCLEKNFTKRRQKNRRLPTVAYGYSMFQGEANSDFHKTSKAADNQMYLHKQIHGQRLPIENTINDNMKDRKIER